MLLMCRVGRESSSQTLHLHRKQQFLIQRHGLVLEALLGIAAIVALMGAPDNTGDTVTSGFPIVSHEITPEAISTLRIPSEGKQDCIYA